MSVSYRMIFHDSLDTYLYEEICNLLRQQHSFFDFILIFSNISVRMLGGLFT